MPYFETRQFYQIGEKVERFIQALENIGVRVIQTENFEQVGLELQMNEQKGLEVVNRIGELGKKMDPLIFMRSAADLGKVHTSCVEAVLGVAENGAIWINEGKMGNRLLPFICQHLFLVLDSAAIVEDMHEAYRTIKIDEDGYGVFIAGPSRTADIEQSLVIGVHGPLSLTVFLITNNKKEN
jgi:L-lactate dehydrogenase complex protein LldG